MRGYVVFVSIVAVLCVASAISPSRSAAEINTYHRTAPAWVWYYSAPTQCIVNHEGGVTSANVGPTWGYYGRFQMDSRFEESGPVGARAARRWGHANNWPLSTQVAHAYYVFKVLKRWYNPWPTYWRYHCNSA